MCNVESPGLPASQHYPELMDIWWGVDRSLLRVYRLMRFLFKAWEAMEVKVHIAETHGSIFHTSWSGTEGKDSGYFCCPTPIHVSRTFSFPPSLPPSLPFPLGLLTAHTNVHVHVYMYIHVHVLISLLFLPASLPSPLPPSLPLFLCPSPPSLPPSLLFYFSRFWSLASPSTSFVRCVMTTPTSGLPPFVTGTPRTLVSCMSSEPFVNPEPWLPYNEDTCTCMYIA